MPQEDARPLEEIEAATRKEEARNRRATCDCRDSFAHNHTPIPCLYRLCASVGRQ